MGIANGLSTFINQLSGHGSASRIACVSFSHQDNGKLAVRVLQVWATTKLVLLS